MHVYKQSNQRVIIYINLFNKTDAPRNVISIILFELQW
jgi:hypothetical protein